MTKHAKQQDVTDIKNKLFVLCFGDFVKFVIALVRPNISIVGLNHFSTITNLEKQYLQSLHITLKALYCFSLKRDLLFE